jgi:glycosyltransferase involved in cell wall biosynthesis
MPWLARRYERYICSTADHVFVVSTPLKRHLVDTVGVPACRITVLPNGANLTKFDPHIDGSLVRASYGIGRKTVIGFVGILRPWHGIEILLEAFAGLSAGREDLHLLIVGDGPIEGELKARAAALGISSHVTFCGRIAHDNVRDHVAAFDIAVSPKATFYASPMKILEYMAMAKPVIAPAMDNIRDIIDDGRTGQLFEPESIHGLRQALQALVDDRALCARLGGQARAEIESARSWEMNARRVIDHVKRSR